jgi:hypothetical protein
VVHFDSANDDSCCTRLEGDHQSISPWLCSIPSIALRDNELDQQISDAIERIKNLVETHEDRNSGFKVEGILNAKLSIAKYDVIVGSSYIPLPPHIAVKRECINVKNNDENCFLYSILAQNIQPKLMSARSTTTKSIYRTLRMYICQ